MEINYCQICKEMNKKNVIIKIAETVNSAESKRSGYIE